MITDLNGGGLLKLVMMIFIPSAGETYRDVRLLLFHGSRRITNCDADSWAGARIGIRTVEEVRMMKRHLTRLQNDIDRVVHIECVGNCVASSQNVCLLWFFDVLEGARVSSRQHAKTTIVDSAVGEGDPCGHETRF